MEVDGVRVLTPHTFLYNLGNVYLVDGLLGVADLGPVHTGNEFPYLVSQGPGVLAAVGRVKWRGSVLPCGAVKGGSV